MLVALVGAALATSPALAQGDGPSAASQPTADAPGNTDAVIVGDWLGALETPIGALRLLVTIRATDDGGFEGELDSLDQSPGVKIPLTTVSLDGTTFAFASTPIGATYTGELSADGTTIDGEFSQGAPLALVLERVESGSAEVEAAMPNRPQTPELDGSYLAHEVTVPSVEGVTLAGTLTVPAGERPFPAVVMVTGSGPQDRDETLFQHKPFAVIADHLTRQGIAVLRYDDRGTASSTGDFDAAGVNDLADDAHAAMTWLAERPEVDAARVGVIGHSEGGLIAPMLAARTPAPAFLVLLAGPGTSGRQIIIDQFGLLSRAEGMGDAEADELVAELTVLLDLVLGYDGDDLAGAVRDALTAERLAALGVPEDQREQYVDRLSSPGYRTFLAYQPADVLPHVTQPVLALNGTLDLQVPYEQNLAGLRAGLSNSEDVTALSLEGLNHLFQTATTGAISEYAQIEETFAPSALELISEWIDERFGNR